MSELSKTIGIRIRNYRLKAGFTQEKLADLSDCHPTYIGQVERGEKNVTIESFAKIAKALSVSMSTLLEEIDITTNNSIRNIPLEMYDLVSAKTIQEQEQILAILKEIDKYRNSKK